MLSPYIIAAFIALLGVIIALSLVVLRLYAHHKAGKSGTRALAANLQDEKQRSNIILNSIEDGVLLLDQQGVIRLFNPAGTKITGWPVDEAVGMDWQQVVKLVDSKGEPYNDDINPFKRVFKSEQPIRDKNAVLVTRANKQMPINLSLTPLINASKQVYGAVAIFSDVTQERREEQQRSDFVSTASHEMRTPVAAIEGYLALALNDKVSTIDSRARDYLGKAHASTEHLGQLFQDLLTSAKAEDGRLTSHPTVVEMGEYLEQLSNDLRFVAEKKGLIMEFVVGASGTDDTIDATTASRNIVKPLYYVKADPDRMREVITNIFDNAVKYTDTGKVSIGLTGDANVVQIYVRDTGPGIAAEDLPHLFQKFYRVDNSATRTIGGTGLGLFICRKIVELYQGRIWVESTQGKGSSFFINLPRLSTSMATEALKNQPDTTVNKPLTSLTTPVLQ